MVILEALKATLMWSLIFVLRAVFIVLGVAIVPFAIPAFTFTGEWQLLRLAWWAHPWDHIKDGILGDTRLHYWNVGDQFPPLIKNSPYLKAYWWVAIRNPANNFSRFYRLIGCNLADSGPIQILAQGDTWEFTKVKGKYFSYWGFYQLTPTRETKLGHKIRSKYAGQDWTGRELKAWKGFTLRSQKKGS